MPAAPPPQKSPQKPPVNVGKNPGFRYWLRELWLVVRTSFIFILGAIGFAVLVKYIGKAVVLVLPLLVLFFGVSIYGWIRMRERGKKPPK